MLEILFSELKKMLEENVQEFEVDKKNYKIVFRRFSEDSGEIRYVNENGTEIILRYQEGFPLYVENEEIPEETLKEIYKKILKEIQHHRRSS